MKISNVRFVCDYEINENFEIMSKHLMNIQLMSVPSHMKQYCLDIVFKVTCVFNYIQLDRFISNVKIMSNSDLNRILH